MALEKACVVEHLSWTMWTLFVLDASVHSFDVRPEREHVHKISTTLLTNVGLSVLCSQMRLHVILESPLVTALYITFGTGIPLDSHVHSLSVNFQRPLGVEHFAANLTFELVLPQVDLSDAQAWSPTPF